ncbi:GNAT family N-acetyltransferase [Gimibacter soli]|uniref:GNAT family N-acetyltransferase n=1 Tax=Gimibacter soli TaxID=3024400 RepID=A0AAF0BL64_9PROT|nr:GNAT family N-acetyltransferase [Gimibacter soli]WCL52801.1 GNAT family N-acetyltransferase [Gimibacter soli]
MTTPQRIDHPSLPYVLSFDAADLDFTRMHPWYAEEAYWCKGIALEKLTKAFLNSLSVGLYEKSASGLRQVGAGRAITDRATFAYLADVFLADEARGQGLGEWMVATLLAHPDLADQRRQLLATSNMHALYAKFGFTALSKPEILMEKVSAALKAALT